MPDFEIPAAYRQAADAIRKYGATAEAAAELLRRAFRSDRGPQFAEQVEKRIAERRFDSGRP